MLSICLKLHYRVIGRDCKITYQQKYDQPVQIGFLLFSERLILAISQAFFFFFKDYQSNKYFLKCVLWKYILDWPKNLFGCFCNILWENPNELFDQPIFVYSHSLSTPTFSYHMLRQR